MKSLNISKEFLIEEYLNKDRTQEEIANEIGCNRETIRNYLVKYDIPRKSPFRFQKQHIISKEYLVQHYVKLRKSTHQIAKELNCTHNVIRENLKQYNIIIEQRTRIEDLSGKSFGDWVVLDICPIGSGRQTKWLCRCSCGSEKRVYANSLKAGRSTSCGCKNKKLVGELHRDWKGYKEISGKFWDSIIRGAKSRNLEFNITIEFAWHLYIQQDRRCSLSGLTIKFPKKTGLLGTASLDRKDSQRGYLKDNIQWVHKDINKMKMDLDESDFIKYCNLIAKQNPMEI